MTTIDRVAVVAPRVLGLAMAGFLALFAFDGFTLDLPLPYSFTFTVLNLAPALTLFLVVVLGWHRPLVGALGFMAAAVLYAWVAPQGRFDWVLAISGPLVTAGCAFLWSWMRPPRTAPAAQPS